MGLTPVHDSEWTKAIMLARTALHPDSLDYALAPWSFPEKDPVQDRIVWLEYLQTVVKGRTEWKDFYHACHEVL
jgi:hypothetical protein